MLQILNKEVPATSASPASVLSVFGNNLRLLTSLRGTQAKVYTDLGISRIQFQRYLRSESFPKPHILKKICDYFLVDARVLLDPLNERLLAEMALANSPDPLLVNRMPWMSAIGFALPEKNYFDDGGTLETGVYTMWQWCGARKNTILRKLIKIYRQNGAMVLRGYTPREFFPAGTPLAAREHRGICLYIENQGYTLLTFFPKPAEIISMAFVKPMQLSEYSSRKLIGFHAITRGEIPGMPRLSRVILEKVGSSPADLVRQAHMPSLYTLENLPQEYADLLSSPPT